MEKNWLDISGVTLALIVFAAFGYFVYGGINGAFAMIVLLAVYWMSLIFALIPAVGFIVQGLAIHIFIWPLVAEFTGIEPTWLTLLALVFVWSLGIMVTWVMTVYAHDHWK